jgi:protein-disulfide isomerase
LWLLLFYCSAAGTVASAGELSTGAAHEVAHVPPPSMPIRGPRFAPVTIDLYFTFGHGPSAVGAELARRAVESARLHDVRELVRLAPLGPVSNSLGAELGAEALIEAEAQGHALEFLDRVEREQVPLNAADLSHAAAELGLDAARFAAALEDHRHMREVDRRGKEALSAGHSAGELLVNGRRSSVWISEEGLGGTIQEARKRAQQLLDDGVPLGHVYDKLVQPAASIDEPPRDAQKRKRISPDLDGAPSRGPALAPVTIVVFSSLACVNCSESFETLRRLRDAWPGRIREVWRSFVPSYAGPTAIDTMAAELAAEAARQDRFWPLHDALYSRPMSGLPRRPPADLEKEARDAGVDLAHRDAVLDRAQADRDRAEGRRLNIPYAPTLLVNGILFTGSTSFERLDRAVRAELERGLADRLSQ